MTRSQIHILMKKDWDLSKWPLLGFLALGLVSFAIIIFGKTQLAFTIGGVLLISTIIILGAFLVTAIVANERKEMTLPFIMSLPVTIMQYSWAKLWLCLTAYVMLWALLVGGAFALTLTTPIPDGMMALFIPMFGGLMCFFVLMLAVALVTESQQATVVVMTCCNIGVSFFIFAVVRVSGIGEQLENAAFTWVPTLTWLMAGEVLFVLAAIGLTVVLQLRKTDFI